MKNRLNKYLAYIDSILSDTSDKDSDYWEGAIEEHLTQIGFFMHERLVHLLVTLTFAILTVFSVGVIVISGQISFGLLTLALMVLLIPYVMHYYLLENGVQKMYEQYDEMLGRKKTASK